MTATDLTADNITWDLGPLLPAPADEGIEQLRARADAKADELAPQHGKINSLDADGLVAFMHGLAEVHDLIGRAGSFVGLDFAADTTDPARGARMQMVDERSTAISTKLLFFDLEWAELPDDQVDAFLSDDRLTFAAHNLRSARRYRPHLLTEPEEVVLTEKEVTGRSAWERLFDEQVSAITVELDCETSTLEASLARLHAPARAVRQSAAAAVTEGLQPGLRTRAFVLNTLLADKATDDRIRHFSSWIAARNLSNEASDESVEALVEAVQGRYGIAQRWYTLKAQLLGIPKLADYDRMASVGEVESEVGWEEAKALVLDAYNSFSGELADTARQFFDNPWIDAPARSGKRPGAFCAYTVPSHHPYLLLNWTSRRRDVLTLAHELGHGLHAYLARGQGVFHQSTPLTLAETASVFGETVTFGRLLEQTSDPNERLALLAESLEGAIATVFRQVAMNRFEDAVHTQRRDECELSIDQFNAAWESTQAAMLGDTVEITEGYRTWWSYIPHFMGTPGYVYAYSYGQLLALSVYRAYEQRGDAFVPQYLELLAAGGSRSPEELGRIVGLDLADPGFWTGGLAIVDEQLEAAEAAARESGRL